MGAVVPPSLTRANLQASVLGLLGLVSSGFFSAEPQRIILVVILSLVLLSLGGPSARRAFPFLFDVDPKLRGRIAAEIVLADNPDEVFAQWQAGPYSVHASAVLLAMQAAIDSAVRHWDPVPAMAPFRTTSPAAAPAPAPMPAVPTPSSVVSADDGEPHEHDLSI